MNVYGGIEEDAMDRVSNPSLSDDLIEKIVPYMESDLNRHWICKIQGVMTVYSDHEYYWSTKDIEAVKEHEYGFTDSFVDHVLRSW